MQNLASQLMKRSLIIQSFYQCIKTRVLDIPVDPKKEFCFLFSSQGSLILHDKIRKSCQMTFHDF